MTRYQHNNTQNFASNELLPIKNCWFRIAHVEEGVLVLALDGFTKRGIEIVGELRAKLMEQQLEEMKEVAKDTN